MPTGVVRYDAGMILTVTPNPALDYTIRVDAFELGRRSKYRDPRIDPAGKGINVSRMVRRLGGTTLALGFAAGATGDLLRQGLDAEGVPHEFISVDGLTRINVTLLTGPEGSATHVHGPGRPVTDGDVRRLLDRISVALARARMVILSGSFPPGLSSSFVFDLVARARSAGVRSIIDTEGDLLGAAVEAKADLVKPNLLEAAEYLNRTLKTVDDAVAAAREITARGAGAAVLTMRGDGAVGVSGGRAWHVQAPREDVVRAIGAGDSFAAGLAAGLTKGATLPDALRLAAAAGTATALHSGTGLGTPEEVDRLRERTVVREISG
jgi:1-phosphofructokinase family hexose kinase